MEIIVVEVKLLTSNMSNCWSTGSNWFSCGVVYFYKFILPLIHRFGRRSQKRLASAGLFFVIYRLTCNVIGHCTKLDWIVCLCLYSDGGLLELPWHPFWRNWCPFYIVVLRLPELNMYLLRSRTCVLIFIRSGLCSFLVFQSHFSM